MERTRYKSCNVNEAELETRYLPSQQLRSATAFSSAFSAALLFRRDAGATGAPGFRLWRGDSAAGAEQGADRRPVRLGFNVMRRAPP